MCSLKIYSTCSIAHLYTASKWLIDRFVVIRGQALAYKMDHMAISSARAKMEQNFEIRRFHDAVLDCVGPLDNLKHCVLDYFESA